MALSVPEVRRLVLTRAADPDTQAFLLDWSRFRRAHQAVAQRCHVARRRQEHASSPTAVCPAPSAEGPATGLTEAEWEHVRSLLPPQQPAVGRRRHDHRTVLSGMLWVFRSAAPWREMPVEFGKWNTAYVRYRLWREQGCGNGLLTRSARMRLLPYRPVRLDQAKCRCRGAYLSFGRDG